MKKSLLTNLTLLFFLFNFASIAQDDGKPQYKSLLWEISGNGLDEPSYLYGTMHVSKKLAFHLGDPFFEALESCDMVALELNPDTWMKDLSESDLLQESYSAMSRYGTDLYNNSFKIPFPKNRDLAAQLATNSNLINGLLYRSNNYSKEFEEETYLDLYIFQTGQRMGKEVFSLENYKEVMEFSQKAMIPDEEKEKTYQRNYKDLFKDTSPQELLQDSYRKGDLNMVDSISKLMNPSKNYLKNMLYDRNEIMAFNMDSIIQSGTSLFTGVGAAHLAGEMGVIEMMRAKGYTMTPIDKGIDGKSKKYEKKYDDIIVPFNFRTESIDDNFYTISAPGEMYTMPSYGGDITYIHPDMANGAYYWVKRIKTYDMLQNFSLEHTYLRMDSLLYENIPGEILTQKEIEVNGYKGIDIVNETREGDIQRYQIIITPLEILVFKIGGKEGFVTEYGDTYFDNIKIEIPEGKKLIKTRPPEGGFSLMLPDHQIMYRLQNSIASGGPGIEYQAIDEKGDYYLVRKTVFNDLGYIEEDEFELNHFITSFIEDDRYDTLMTKIGTYENHPSIDVTYTVKGMDKKLHARLIIKGPEYFMISKLTEQSFDACQDYFNSFQFEEVLYEDEFEVMIDSLLCFKTTSVKLSEEAEMIRKLRILYQQAVKKKEVENLYASESKYRQIRSSGTGEEVSIHMDRYNTFKYIENIDELWEEEMEWIEEETEHQLIRVKKSQQDSLYILEMLEVDTGSTRGVWIKKILCNRTLYTLQSNIDTLREPSKFITETFNNFHVLADTSKQRSIFENSNDLFFEFLASGDSLKIDHAFNSRRLVNFEDDEERLLNLLNNFSFEDQGMDERAGIIRSLSQIKSKSVLNYLEQEYLRQEDTTTYQLACISTLSRMQTPEAVKLLKELLVNNPMIPSTTYGLDNVYYNLVDSVELSKTVFPDIMELSTFPEYKANNLYLLSHQIYYQALKNKVIKKYKRQLVNEALIELKRQFASEEGDDDKKKAYNYYDSDEVNSDLINYAIVVSPWYKKDDKVKKFFRDVLRLKDQETLIRILTNMENAGIPVEQATWDKLVEDEEIQTYMLEQLRSDDLEYRFKKELLTQENIAYSNLISSNNDFDLETDSTNIQFIDKYLIKSKDREGYYYFYKCKTKDKYSDDVKWNIYYTGPQPVNLDEVTEEYSFVTKSEEIDPDSDNEDLLDEIKLKIELKGRERVREKNDYYGGGGYY